MKLPVQFIFAITLLSISVGISSESCGQFNIPFRRSQTTTQSLQLTESSGPWLIMCYSFSGDDGAQQAKRMATELRTRHGLKAYTYTKNFDLNAKVQKSALIGKRLLVTPDGETALDENGQAILIDENMKTAGISNFAETAVLVGDFESLDDDRAQKTMAKIKTIAPECLQHGDATELANADSLAGGTLRARREGINKMLNSEPGRLRNAFLLTNPMLPDEYFARNSIDKFVMGLNKKIKYSLLDCPGNYSVRVATFRGDTTINVQEIQQKMDEMKWLRKTKRGLETKLDICANKANVLTKALRNDGIEAYEFHDREESYVCIGSFDWISRKDDQGQVVEQNSEVRNLILKYRGSVISKPGNATLATQPKVLPSLRHLKNENAIVFDVQPLPVVVPKAPASVAEKLLNKWR